MDAASTSGVSDAKTAGNAANGGSGPPLTSGLPAASAGSFVEFDGSIVHDSDIVGTGTGLRDVVARVEQVAGTDTPVLLEGETGSGKEVIARMIHARSRRARGPMIRVNCGAIPAELLDSELFGHERGSFTGATATRLGWFERADGGTLFLDEVAELPPGAQVRLLRVLQDGVIERVGGGRSLKVDVRVITATHRDLRAMQGAGEFRADLWYRISVFSVRIPPLRDRMQDLPALATYFAQRAGVRLTGVQLVPTVDDLAALLRYHWPGNVRELAAVIERAAILGGGRRLHVAAALGDSAEPPSSRGSQQEETFSSPRSASEPRLPQARNAQGAPASVRGIPAAAAAPFPTLDEAMRGHIEQALSIAGGRVEGAGGAADLLGLNPHTLRGKMRKLRIDWATFRGHRP